MALKERNAMIHSTRYLDILPRAPLPLLDNNQWHEESGKVCVLQTGIHACVRRLGMGLF